MQFSTKLKQHLERNVTSEISGTSKRVEKVIKQINTTHQGEKDEKPSN